VNISPKTFLRITAPLAMVEISLDALHKHATPSGLHLYEQWPALYATANATLDAAWQHIRDVIKGDITPKMQRAWDDSFAELHKMASGCFDVHVDSREAMIAYLDAMLLVLEDTREQTSSRWKPYYDTLCECMGQLCELFDESLAAPGHQYGEAMGKRMKQVIFLEAA